MAQQSRRTTIRDIAEAAGVSPAAVSFSLNGRPGVAETTRERVLAVAAHLGWTPNAAARALSVSQASAVGLVIARVRDSFSTEQFFFEFIVGVQEALRTRRLSLMLQIVETVEEELAVHREWWQQRRVDGVIILDPREHDPRPGEVRRLGLPAVVVGEAVDGLASVSTDDEALMTEIVDHLAGLDRRRVAYVCGISSLTHVQHRVRSLSAAGRRLDLEVMVSASTDATEDAGLRETTELLSGRRRPDAIVFDNEILALGGLAAIRARGLAVGRDVAVISCEDSVVCRVVEPPLTAAHRDPADLGRHAADLLSEVLSGGPPRTIHEQLATLIPRRSSTGG